MGNEYGWRKERLRAEGLRRFWRTSIFITCSTCGSKRGVESERTVRSSSCYSPRGWIPEQSGCRTVPGGTHGENEEVQPGIASRENAAAGIWSVGDQQPAKAWRREARDIQLSRLHAYLREEEEQRNVHGAAANDPQKTAGEAERGESRASAAHARTHPRTGQVVASGRAWTHPVLRGAHEHTGAVDLSVPSGAALASRAVAAQPEWPCPLGSYAAPHQPLA